MDTLSSAQRWYRIKVLLRQSRVRGPKGLAVGAVRAGKVFPIANKSLHKLSK